MGGRAKDSIEKIQEFLDSQKRNITVISEYVNSKTPITCECNSCGHVWETLSTALKGRKHGCGVCAGKKSKTVEHIQAIVDSLGKNFIVLSKAERKYHYLLQCKLCDYVWESQYSNIKLNGCAECNKKTKWTLERLQKLLDERKSNIEVSGDSVKAFSLVDCKCCICSHSWKAKPHNLSFGKGCPSCAKTGFDPSKPGILYYLRVEKDSQIYWKIGITNLSVKERFKASELKFITTLYSQLFEDGSIAQKAERSILGLFSKYKAKGVKILKSGNTELFVKDVLQMDHLI